MDRIILPRGQLLFTRLAMNYGANRLTTSSNNITHRPNLTFNPATCIDILHTSVDVLYRSGTRRQPNPRKHHMNTNQQAEGLNVMRGGDTVRRIVFVCIEPINTDRVKQTTNRNWYQINRGFTTTRCFVVLNQKFRFALVLVLINHRRKYIDYVIETKNISFPIPF